MKKTLVYIILSSLFLSSCLKTEQYIEIGNTKLAQGKYEKALDFYNKAIKSNPKDAKIDEVYYYRGMAKEEMGEVAEAIEDYNLAINLNKKNPIFYNRRGLAQNKLTNYEAAIDDMNEAIKLSPNEAYFYIDRAASHDGSGRPSLALNDFKKAIELNPNLPEAEYNIAVFYAKHNFYAESFSHFEKAITLYKKNNDQTGLKNTQAMFEKAKIAAKESAE